MRFSGIVGLAGIVDSLRVWRGFLAQIVTLYQEWIRLPIYNTFIAIWPTWLLPTPPRIGVDLLIIWSAFFAAASYHVYYEDGRNIVSHIYAKESMSHRLTRVGVLLRTVAKVVTIFLIGPVFYPLKALSHWRNGGRSGELIITPWLVMNPRAILKYVLFQFCALMILLLINYTAINQFSG